MIKRLAPDRQRDRVLTENEIRKFWAALDQEHPTVRLAMIGARSATSSSSLRTSRCCLSCVAQRGGEIYGATWSEMTSRAAGGRFPPNARRSAWRTACRSRPGAQEPQRSQGEGRRGFAVGLPGHAEDQTA
jgi:hypothetical protein